MSKTTLAFFFGLLLIMVAIARYNLRSVSTAEQIERKDHGRSELVPPATPVRPDDSPPASVTPTPAKAADFAKIAAQIQPAVVLISVFEPSGKLLKTGAGFFVSDDGRIITSRSVMEGGAHAVVKRSDGEIDNILGIIGESESGDVVVLKAEVKDRVPFAIPAAAANPGEGSKVAVVGSPLGKVKPGFLERAVGKRRSDGGGEQFDLSSAVPLQTIGSPVIDDRGQVIGLVTRGPGNPPVVVRTSRALDAVEAQVTAQAQPKWLSKEESPPAPAEGPKKLPLAGGPRRSKLVYSPRPEYPSWIRDGSSHTASNGQYRVTFDPDGQVKEVSVVHSTRNATLDKAAVEALRHWKATPGERWTLTVPITFRP